jgi:predicted polyphosphate/ATP-dependent NAD kinase
MMNRLNVGCIIVVGGDGTNRVVAKGCGDTPILPLSTGTNNVIPYMIESTVAGLAAGLVAQKIVSKEECTTRLKKLHIIKNGEWIDIALVDAVVTDDLFVGARAVWDVPKIKQVITTRGEPYNIGMSSIVGCLHPISINDDQGFHLKIGKGGLKVRAPIAPGIVREIEVLDFKVLNINDKVEVSYKPSMVALDGEREVEVYDKDFVEVKLCKDGPLIVDVERVLREAVKKEIFVSR